MEGPTQFGCRLTTSTCRREPELAWRAFHALERLAAEDPRKARVVELRFFGGLTVEETAKALEVSPRTVHKDWVFARAWLYRALTAGASHEH